MNKTPTGFMTQARLTRLSTPVLLACALLAGPVSAQTPAPTTVEREPVRTLEQKTERIVHQDAGSRIQELRVGGQTRSIDVQTSSTVPAYQVQPIDPSLAPDERQPNGARSWRVLNF